MLIMTPTLIPLSKGSRQPKLLHVYGRSGGFEPFQVFIVTTTIIIIILMSITMIVIFIIMAIIILAQGGQGTVIIIIITIILTVIIIIVTGIIIIINIIFTVIIIIIINTKVVCRPPGPGHGTVEEYDPVLSGWEITVSESRLGGVEKGKGESF